MNAPALIGLTGDGTSNGMLLTLTNRGLAAAAVVVAGFFAWKMLMVFVGGTSDQKGSGQFTSGGGRDGTTTKAPTRALISEATAFMVVEGLIATVWLLVNFGQQFVSAVTT